VKLPERKIVPVDELVAVREEHRRRGELVVQCHGCFDIVHPGHLRYLRFAREQGDVLSVSVSSDRMVGKGADRPYVHQDLRLENLAALEMVDYVCLDDHAWAGPVLDTLRPDVYVKGKEYEKSTDARFVEERKLVEGFGGKVIFSSGEVVYSSTFILDQFRQRFQLEEEKLKLFCRRHGIDRAGLAELLDTMSERRVLVVGDPVLDRYVHCDSLGVASESPVLDVAPIREDWYLGAAALIAAQIRALGSRASLLSVLGDAPGAARFRERLERYGVEPILLDEDRPLYVKTRYLVEESKVFKVNEGRYAPLSTEAVRRFVRELEDRGGDFDVWIVSDFGYGLFGQQLIEAISATAGRLGVPFTFDVSQKGAGNLLKVQGPALATPTEAELRFALGDRESGLSHLAARYYRQTGAERLLVTLGKRGVVLFGPPQEGHDRLATDYQPAMVSHPVDTVGAGDLFLATVSLARSAGAASAAGAYLGSCVSALGVRQIGNDPVERTDLDAWLDGRPELNAAP
jgi:rfaE bifunctional protein kinase chain/domain/rfaE bifunctional protein nucleotidyltransferase chain/domain